VATGELILEKVNNYKIKWQELVLTSFWRLEFTSVT
jgi:hypothetical protein